MGVKLSDYIMADVMLHTSEVWLKLILQVTVLLCDLIWIHVQ